MGCLRTKPLSRVFSARLRDSLLSLGSGCKIGGGGSSLLPIPTNSVTLVELLMSRFPHLRTGNDLYLQLTRSGEVLLPVAHDNYLGAAGLQSLSASLSVSVSLTEGP